MKSDFVYDYAVIGAGIAGASLAYQLASVGRVLILEQEDQPGYHTTGRSAAMFMASYGPPAARALTRASRAFYVNPPPEFCEHPIVSPRGCLYVASAEQLPRLHATFAALKATDPNVHLVDRDTALMLCPMLRPEWAACAETEHSGQQLIAIHEPDAMDLDVHALHQGYLSGAKRRGAILQTRAKVLAAKYDSGRWAVGIESTDQVMHAKVLINAAGAWATPIANLCAARPIEIEPRRRSAFTFDAPNGMDCSHWPTIADLDETFYFKPDAGQLLGSPANADPTFPHDVVAEEIDIATGIDRIQTATTANIRRPKRVWAGLRSFSPDKELVIGWDIQTPKFFWFAGQGGYGIQSAAAASELAAALLTGQQVPAHIQSELPDQTVISPARFN
jgi:D-arginine dehydrogenase